MVTNILKHSESSRVDASVYQKSGSTYLSVSDDGVGFKQGQPNGFGLKGISERVANLKGKLSIQSNDGTQIQIEIPNRP